MRPSLLDPLFSPITTLPGIGSKVAALIERVLPLDLGGREPRVGDLLFVLPNSVIDRRSRPGIAGSAENESAHRLAEPVLRHRWWFWIPAPLERTSPGQAAAIVYASCRMRLAYAPLPAKQLYRLRSLTLAAHCIQKLEDLLPHRCAASRA